MAALAGVGGGGGRGGGWGIFRFDGCRAAPSNSQSGFGTGIQDGGRICAITRNLFCFCCFFLLHLFFLPSELTLSSVSHCDSPIFESHCVQPTQECQSVSFALTSALAISSRLTIQWKRNDDVFDRNAGRFLQTRRGLDSKKPKQNNVIIHNCHDTFNVFRLRACTWFSNIFPTQGTFYS